MNKTDKVELNYLKDCLVDLDKEEHFDVSGGSAGGIIVGGAAAVGAGAIVFRWSLCQVNQPAPKPRTK